MDSTRRKTIEEEKMYQHARQRRYHLATWLSLLTAVKELYASVDHSERRRKPFTSGGQQVLTAHVGHKCTLLFCLGMCHVLACDSQSAA